MVKIEGKSKMDKIMGDFELFSKNFIEISNSNGDRQKLTFNSAQKEIVGILEDNKYLILPKSRQAGCTTLFQSLAIFRAQKPHQTIMIVSFSGESSSNIFNKLRDMNACLPRDKFPPGTFAEVKHENKNELSFTNGSRIISSVAGDKDLGRSMSLDMVLLSELSFYNDIDRQLNAILQAVNRSKDSRVIIESSANGMNSFYDMCMAADKGQSRFKLYFLGFQHPLYLDQWKEEINEAEKIFKSQNNGKKMTPKDFDDAEKVLYEKYDTHIRSLMWRRMKLLDSNLQDFQQEYPSNLYEAFVNSSGNTIFNQTKILERMDYITPPMTRDVLEGIIPDSLLQYVGRGNLEIYQTPEAGKRYVGGVDTASGSGGNSDDSAISLLNDENIEVASLSTNKLSPHDFAQVVNDIGLWYNYAYLAIERNGGYGGVCLQVLREQLGYENLYRQRIFDKRGKRSSYGFLTTEATKKTGISLFRQNFQTDMLLINSKKTLEQMTIYQINSQGKMGNVRGAGKKDDLIISMMLANVAAAENIHYA